MNKLTAFAFATLLATSAATAKVSFSLDIEALTQSDGVTSISGNGLIVLVVDTGSDGFQLPAAGNLASGTDEVVAYWDLSDYSFNSADITLVTEGGVNYGSNWSTGDKLALFWFPTLSSSNMSPTADTVYGVFADAIGLASGDHWVMPSDGTLLHSLKLFTSAATTLVSSGEQPSSVGKTAFSVNSPPSTTAPSVPSLGVANGGGKSTLTWTNTSAPEGGYVVQRKLNGGVWESIGVTESGATSFEDSNVKPGRNYEYRLYSIGTFAATLSNLPSAVTSERSVLANVSARSRVVAGDPVTQMFGGVVLDGTDPTKNVILQAIGRSYFKSDTDPAINFIANPAFDIYINRVFASSNDDWMSSLRALDIDGAMAVGNAVLLADDQSSKDSTELIEAPINVPNTFAVSSKDGDSGDVLLGIFDADSDLLGRNDNRIVNLSARGYLSNEAGSLFAGGMIIRGNVPKEVLVMAWGPYLSGKVDDTLEGLTVVDPKLVLYKGSTVVATNDNWESQTASATAGITIETDAQRIRDVVENLGYQSFDSGSLDSMLLMTLNPGAYTFAFEGNGGTGIGLIAVEEVEID